MEGKNELLLNPATLPPCPCGEIPERLRIEGDGDRPKWAMVSGSCCVGWWVEFNNNWRPLDSEGSLRRATEAWTDAPRAKQKTQA